MLCSCSTSGIYFYEEGSVRFIEKNGYVSHSLKTENCSTDYAEYHFDKRIEKNERKEYIKLTDSVLKLLSPAEKMCLYIFTEREYSSSYIDEYGTLYIGGYEPNSAEYIAEILAAVYGKYCNYGLCYGYANHILSQLGGTRITVSELPSVENSAIYDMNALCFNDKFVSAEDIESAKRISVYFTEEYIAEHSEENFLKLLTASGNIERIDEVNKTFSQFYAANSIDYKPVSAIYRNGGESHEFYARTPYAFFIIPVDWADDVYGRAYDPEIYAYPLIGEDFLHSDYLRVKDFFSYACDIMGDFQERLKMGEYNNELCIQFENNKSTVSVSYYDSLNHTIHISSVFSLSHEYFHSISVKYSKQEPWCIEGLATYFPAVYDDFYRSFLAKDYNNIYSGNNPLSEKDALYPMVINYGDEIGGVFDLSTDYAAMYGLAVYARRLTTPNAGDGYGAGASFIHYLVSEYGEDTAFNYICSRNGKYAELDRTFDELVSDWLAYLSKKYADYDKIR